jgi:hypothetical protein
MAEQHVDVADVVQLGPAELAHAQHRQPHQPGVGHLPGGGQLALKQVERVHPGQGRQVLGPRPELAAELGAAGEVLDGLLGPEAAGGGGHGAGADQPEPAGQLLGPDRHDEDQGQRGVEGVGWPPCR